jgi:hypothetical protein
VKEPEGRPGWLGRVERSRAKSLTDSRRPDLPGQLFLDFLWPPWHPTKPAQRNQRIWHTEEAAPPSAIAQKFPPASSVLSLQKPIAEDMGWNWAAMFEPSLKMCQSDKSIVPSRYTRSHQQISTELAVTLHLYWASSSWKHEQRQASCR